MITTVKLTTISPRIVSFLCHESLRNKSRDLYLIYSMMTMVNNTVWITVCIFKFGPPVFSFSGRGGSYRFKGRNNWDIRVVISGEVTWLINAFSQSTSIYWIDEGRCSLNKELNKTDMVSALAGRQKPEEQTTLSNNFLTAEQERLNKTTSTRAQPKRTRF